MNEISCFALNSKMRVEWNLVRHGLFKIKQEFDIIYCLTVEITTLKIDVVSVLSGNFI